MPLDTYRIQVADSSVGPLFDTEQEEAHSWVARNYPGAVYTVITLRDGQPDLEVEYRPEASGVSVGRVQMAASLFG